DRKSVIRARVEALDRLVTALSPEEDKPRVLILCSVPQLNAEQRDAVARFLDNGGGVLVTLGAQVDRRQYNNELYQQGIGWLPGWLDGPPGEEPAPPPAEGKGDPAAHPLPSSFSHPALELFRGEADAGLGKARFPRWWKVAAPLEGAAASTVARFTTLDPFLVERPYGQGRVSLCSAPLDDSWATNRPGGLEVQEFPLLAHELVYYLAGIRSLSFNLVPGQPLIYQPFDGEALGTVQIQPPHGEAKRVEVTQWPLIHDDTREP